MSKHRTFNLVVIQWSDGPIHISDEKSEIGYRVVSNGPCFEVYSFRKLDGSQTRHISECANIGQAYEDVMAAITGTAA